VSHDPDAIAGAFVVWVEPGEPGAPPLRGRVEHVQSSERVRFETAEELLRFLERRLRQRAGEGGEGA
jgi:hypothetical protein